MTVRDPVCGMEINPESASSKREHMGQTFYFCSKSCANQFDKDPHGYASPGFDTASLVNPVVSSATTGIAPGTKGPVRIALPVGGLQKSGGPALESAIHALSGVRKVTANVKERRVFVDYDPSRI